jgi:hypothetical protein
LPVVAVGWDPCRRGRGRSAYHRSRLGLAEPRPVEPAANVDWDADVFDSVFDGMAEHNDEGDVVRSADDRQGLSFDGATVERLLAGQTVAPSGAACLHLAWQHRASLLS